MSPKDGVRSVSPECDLVMIETINTVLSATRLLFDRRLW